MSRAPIGLERTQVTSGFPALAGRTVRGESVRNRSALLAPVLFLVLAYQLGAALGLTFLLDTWTSTLWPPSGICLAAVLLGGYRLWVGVAIGSFIANVLGGLQRGIPFDAVTVAAALITAGNTLQALVAAFLVRRTCGPTDLFGHWQTVLTFVLLGPMASTTISAFFGTAALYLNGIIPWQECRPMWANWWLGNMMGGLIFAPLILVWWTQPISRAQPRTLWEAVVVFALLITVSQLVFGSAFAPNISRYPLVYLPMPLVGWAALRFGPRGAVTANALLVSMAVRSTVGGAGPFVQGTTMESLFLLQTFDVVSAVTALVLAAIVFDRQRAAGELRAARDSLEDRVAERTAELRGLSLRLRSVREEERSRIAREIHDDLGQSLTALKIDVGWLAKRAPSAPVDFHEKLRSMGRTVDATIQSLRRIATELRPSVLDQLGLFDALDWELEQFQARTDVHCTLTVDADETAIGAARSTDVFRVFQEALTNIARHANATQVRVLVTCKEERLVLDLQDNGCGIREGALWDHASIGLIGMRERIERWGGRLQIEGLPSSGTRVWVELPLAGTDGTTREGAE